MKGIIQNSGYYFKFFMIILFFVFLSACGGVTPGTDLPLISSFTASSTTITQGQSVTLSWATIGATKVYLGLTSESIGSTGTVDPTGSKTVSPSETTTYTLTANSGSNSDSSTITITVTEDTTGFPTIDSFTASATLIEAGEDVTLTWVTTGAATVFLEHSSLSSAGGEAVELSGSTIVSPDEETDYILTATNSAGSVTEKITVTLKLPVWNHYTGVYYHTIQEAIDDAPTNPDIAGLYTAAFIKALPGVYYENLIFRDDLIVSLTADVDDPADFVIDGRGLDSVIKVYGGEAWLNGITIRNGKADNGGGIHIINAVGSTINCVICDNEARYSGGGICVGKGHIGIADDTIIRDNDANSYGGGIYIENSSARIHDSLIIGNHTGMKGGGIYIKDISDSDEVTIRRNTIRENRADTPEVEAGGGIYILDDSVDPFLVHIGSRIFNGYSGFNTICSNEPD